MSAKPSNNMFLGRENELETLASLWRRRGSSLVACQGRRRIGKSTLIKEFARRSGARLLKIEGLAPEKGMNNARQLAEFGRSLAAQTGLPPMSPNNWPEAFAALDGAIRDTGKTVVLLDEISWMGGFDKDFPAHLKVAWDNLFHEHRRLVFVVCGSVSAWIQKNILNNTGFVGRFSLCLTLGEMPLRDCLAFWGGAADRISDVEAFDLLSVTGGVPRYLEEIDPAMTADENIRALCFTPTGFLFRDFSQLFSDVFGKRTKAKREILEALADGPATIADIARASGRERNGHIADDLFELQLAGFVSEDAGLNPETGKAVFSPRWRISDPYTRFYLRYVSPRRESVEHGGFRLPALSSLPGWDAMKGFQFETLVLGHADEFIPALGLSRVNIQSMAPYARKGIDPATVGPQMARKVKGCQIDLLVQAPGAYWVVEIKRRKRIGSEIEGEVREKIDALTVPKGVSVRACLIYLGELDPAVEESGFFSAVVQAKDVLRG